MPLATPINPGTFVGGGGGAGGPADELDANGTTLAVNAIADGEYLVRSGTTVVGAAGSGGPATQIDDGTDTLDIATIDDGEGLIRSGTDITSAPIVPTSRTIATTAPITGGGDLSANRTLALTTSPVGQTPVGVTRQIVSGDGITGGGDLSADRTLAVGATNTSIVVATDGIEAVPHNNHNMIDELEDFAGPVSGGAYPNWSLSTSGGALVAVVAPDNDRQGVINISTGTGTTGRSTVRRYGANGGNLRVGGGEMLFDIMLNVPALSDGTDTFTVHAGFGETGAAGEDANAVKFRYTHSVIAGEWQGVCRQGGTESTLDSNVAVVAGTWYRLRAVINAAGNSVEFFVNTVSVGTIVANIPSGAQLVTPQVKVEKSAGSTSRGVDIDRFRYRKVLSR